MKKIDVMNKADMVMDFLLTLKAGDFSEKCPISNIDIDKWEWPQGVAMYGLYRYYTLKGDKKILDWLFDWYDRHLEAGLPPKNINTTSPLIALTYLYEIDPKQTYLDTIKEWADYIMTKFARTEENGFQHSGSNVDYLYGQLWDDTLVMTCLFLGRAGVILGRRDCIDECERQFLLHTKYLCDTSTGLWYHGWSFIGRHNFSKAYWGRGNAWITIAIPEILNLEGLSGSVKEFLKETLLSQVKALKPYQTEEGMWRTLIDDETSYVESSATAGFGYGILRAIRDGYLPKEYADMGIKAGQAILNRVNEYGAIEHVSYGTDLSNDKEDYKKIPYCYMPYGQAFGMLLLSELGLITE
ncbi:MAG: glycoside hydrolase family 88 protein [Clostridia bacterium]|nr:glycoside hydrolase family 88 protein [Clostridia bacterium]